MLVHDTAGMRKQAHAVAGKTLEELSVGSTLAAVRFADCVIVVIDATAPFEKQDLTIADLIAREGRAIVFAINKWDLVEDKQSAVKKLRLTLDESLPQVAGAPLVAISALTGEGLNRLMKAVMAADKAWNTRVPTAQAQPLPRTGARAPSPARGPRPARAHPLHDADQGAAAELRAVRQPAEGAAAGLSALSAERAARGLRP